MSTRHGTGAEAWPIGRESRSGNTPVLMKVVVANKHSNERSEVHLTPDQALYAHSRLSIIKSAYLNGHFQQVQTLGIDHLPADHAAHLSTCGAKVWSIVDDKAAPSERLQFVVLESQHPDGYGMIKLSPDDALHVEERLTQITLAFLHDNFWGGEDARSQ
jgi:hypothetical protein